MKTLSAIITSILAGLMLHSSPSFANSASLPEPRYVQTGVKVEYVAGKRFEIPEIEDRWDDIRDEKADALRKILGSNDDCDSIIIRAQGVECQDYRTECRGSWRTETSTCSDEIYDEKHIRNMDYDPHCQNGHVTKTVCDGTTYAALRTTFDISYTEMYGISKSTSFLNDDNVCFDSDDGESYSLDTSSSGAAAEAASLMKELRDINQAMNAHGPSQSQIHQERELALRAYQAAATHEEKVTQAAACLERAYVPDGSKSPTPFETLNPTTIKVFHDALSCLSSAEESVRREALERMRTQSPSLTPYVTKVESLMTR
ncbi:hypothetical protein HYS47_00595 [Candidatus Woesearchaeota archaeon]|nr:hypothetical protein [Candidatus Woesearchaeota archaeon]